MKLCLLNPTSCINQWALQSATVRSAQQVPRTILAMWETLLQGFRKLSPDLWKHCGSIRCDLGKRQLQLCKLAAPPQKSPRNDIHATIKKTSREWVHYCTNNQGCGTVPHILLRHMQWVNQTSLIALHNAAKGARNVMPWLLVCEMLSKETCRPTPKFRSRAKRAPESWEFPAHETKAETLVQYLPFV